jgi:hypothetical protein
MSISTAAVEAGQSGARLLPAILAATAIAGTLDIADAVIMSLATGRSPVKMLQGIAGAVVGRGSGQGGAPTAILGLALHFAIMLAMVTAFMIAAGRIEALTRRPWLWGPVYGIGLFVVMYGVVLPLRWPPLFGKLEPVQLVNQLFAHTVLVGLPIALVAARFLRG